MKKKEKCCKKNIVYNEKEDFVFCKVCGKRWGKKVCGKRWGKSVENWVVPTYPTYPYSPW